MVVRIEEEDGWAEDEDGGKCDDTADDVRIEPESIGLSKRLGSLVNEDEPCVEMGDVKEGKLLEGWMLPMTLAGLTGENISPAPPPFDDAVGTIVGAEAIELVVLRE